MTLIIAEKPELGRAIAAAIPGGGRTEQSVIYKGGYAVIWAYGHLLTLKEPEDYDPRQQALVAGRAAALFPGLGTEAQPSGRRQNRVQVGPAQADRDAAQEL